MQFGFQTIAWGSWIDDLEGALDVIADAGYQGVEFSQRPECLGSIENLLNLLQQRNLTLIGLMGGTLFERMKFCKHHRGAHLVVFDWHPHAELAIKEGFNLALHPHIYKPKHHLSDMLELLKQHPSLKFLPDTAILTITGDDPLKAIQEGLQLGPNRLAAVHLKNWSSEFGRSSHRYARGFTELDQPEGEVPIEDILLELQNANYGGWVIVEHNHKRKDPHTYAFNSATWLAEKGFRAFPQKAKDPQEVHLNARLSTSMKCQSSVHFLDSVIHASGADLNRCYQSIVKAFCDLVPSDLATLWVYNPAKDRLNLVVADPLPGSEYLNEAVELGNSLSAIAIDRQLPTHFDLTDNQLGEKWGYPDLKFSHPRLLDRMLLKHMVSIPIFNDSNPFHCRLLVEIYSRDKNSLASPKDLSLLGAYAAKAADAALNEHCAYAVAATNIAAAKFNTAVANASIGIADIEHVKDFLHNFKGLLSRFLNCETASIFLVDDSGKKLELNTPGTELIWNPDVPESEFYVKGQGITGTVWATKEAILTLDASTEPSYRGKSHEPSFGPSDPGLIAPLFDHTGEVIGVVRCRRRRGYGNLFTYDHVAIVDAIGQAAAPYLELLRNNERRAKALGGLTHELKYPLSTITAATGRIQSNFIKQRNVASDQFLSQTDHILSCVRLMEGLINNAEFLRAKSRGMTLNYERTTLIEHVVEPAIQQIDALLLEYDFSSDRIQYTGLSSIPPLCIDRIRFQQVIFNLLSNAIKYANYDSNEFAVTIEAGTETSDQYVIYFRDWGMGIPENLADRIFQEGYRSEKAEEVTVDGEGIGLWIVRRIIAAHGGNIFLTGYLNPTELTIYLPISLSQICPDSEDDLSTRG